jgi:hypothetical protein
MKVTQTSLPLLAFVTVIIIRAIVPVVVVTLGLRKARNLTLPFLGIIVEM